MDSSMIHEVLYSLDKKMGHTFIPYFYCLVYILILKTPKKLKLFFHFQYGDIQALVMSPKKNGSALIEFKDRQAAVSIIWILHILFTFFFDFDNNYYSQLFFRLSVKNQQFVIDLKAD